MPPLTDYDRERYEWQMWVDGIGEEGQRKLKGASVLISRVGGVGGNAAMHLAAAGVGKLVLAHAGNVRPTDPHRQLLATEASIGGVRMTAIVERLRAMNPSVELVGVEENVSAANVDRLVEQV